MYPYDREPKKDTLDDDLDKVVSYLVRANKDEHRDAVLVAIRRLASANQEIERLRTELEMHRQTNAAMRSHKGPEPQQTIELPFGTRKVSIEL